ncbi:hypothetical protein Sjap_003906 [Stephania japonica]|uniref:Regulatory protein RecX n=1 Tax=Stephania japonica TaxID=461633 RepID=A0AAP0KPP7_9MAGN
MATFGANLGFKIALEFNSRNFSPTLFVKSSSITCCRCYESSSGPVRYIPNRSAKSEESQSMKPKKSLNESQCDIVFESLRMSDSTQNSGQNWGFGAVKSSGFHANEVYLEMGNPNEETFDEVEIACEDGHGEGDVKNSSKDRLEAERIVITALAARAYTAAELQKKLHGKSFSSVLINEVITDLQQRGLINDYLYAETYSQSRWSTSTWGPRRIKQALQRKGIDEADAERATKHVFEGVDSGGDTDQRFGMSESSMDHLFAQASKLWLRGQNVTHDKRKSRIIRWLQYRSFNWGVISFILKKLESQYPQ